MEHVTSSLLQFPGAELHALGEETSFEDELFNCKGGSAEQAGRAVATRNSPWIQRSACSGVVKCYLPFHKSKSQFKTWLFRPSQGSTMCQGEKESKSPQANLCRICSFKQLFHTAAAWTLQFQHTLIHGNVPQQRAYQFSSLNAEGKVAIAAAPQLSSL